MTTSTAHVTKEAINQVRHMRQGQAAVALDVSRQCLQDRCVEFEFGGWPTSNFRTLRKVADDEGESESESEAEDDDGRGSVCRRWGAGGIMKEILPLLM